MTVETGSETAREPVVVGLAGRLGMGRLLGVARRVAQDASTGVRVVHAYDPAAESMALGRAWPSRRQEKECGEQLLREALALLPGVPATTELVEGAPASVLVARSWTCHTLVLGRSGHSPFRRSVFGSVRDHCLKYAACPVLVVPLGDDDPAG